MQLRSPSYNGSAPEPEPQPKPGPGPEPQPGQGRATRRGLIVGGAVAGVIALAVAVGLAVTLPKAGTPVAATATSAAATARTVATTSTSTGLDAGQPTALSVQAVLDRQANALLHNDLTGWMSAVDPAKSNVRAYYRDLFTSLRALGVTQFKYEAKNPNYNSKYDAHWTGNYDVTYCFSKPVCPPPFAGIVIPEDPPAIVQKLTWNHTNGPWVIEAVTAASGESADWTPTPWQSGGMVWSQGKRVTVGASRGHDKRLKDVVAAADKAAAITDTYARVFGSSPGRYRVYVATDKEWATWFHGEQRDTTIGFTTFPHHSLSEVVIRAKTMGSGADLQNLIQHEFGHVVTIDGVYRGNYTRTPIHTPDWLDEGVAEYISYSGSPATSSDRISAVRRLVHSGKRYKSINNAMPSEDAKLPSINQFYGYSHFAVDCMAHKYGKAKLLAFITETFRNGLKLDPAARKAYGRSFHDVDKTCVSWINGQL